MQHRIRCILRRSAQRSALAVLALAAVGCTVQLIQREMPSAPMSAPTAAPAAAALDPGDPAGCPWNVPVEVVANFETAGAGGSELVRPQRAGARADDPVRVRLRAHAALVDDATFSADGDLFVTSGYDTDAASDASFAIRLWQSDDGTLLDEWAPGESLGNLTLSPSGRIVAGSVFSEEPINSDAVVRDWQKVDSVLRLASARPMAVGPGDDLLAAFRREQETYLPTVTLWDLEDGRLRHTLRAVADVDDNGMVQGAFGHYGDVVSAHFNEDGSRLVTAGHDGIRVWDTVSGAHLFCFKRDGWVDEAWFGPDGESIVTIDGWTLETWDMHTGTQRSSVEIECVERRCRLAPGLDRYITFGRWHGVPATLVYESATGRLLALLYTREDVALAVSGPDARTVLTVLDLKDAPTSEANAGAAPNVLLWETDHPAVQRLVQHSEFVDAATAALVAGEEGRARGYLQRAGTLAPADAPEITAMRLAFNIEDAVARGTWQGASVADAGALVEAAQEALPGVDLSAAWYVVCARNMDPDLCGHAGVTLPPGELDWIDASVDSSGLVDVRSRPDAESRLLYQVGPFSEVTVLGTDETAAWLFVYTNAGPGWLEGVLVDDIWILPAGEN